MHSVGSLSILEDIVGKNGMNVGGEAEGVRRTLEDLRTPTGWHKLGCSCLAEEYDHFVVQWHKLKCNWVPNYKCSFCGQWLKAIFNTILARMGKFSQLEFDTAGRLAPMWFLSISINVRDAKRVYMPAIVNAVEKITWKVELLRRRYDCNVLGSRRKLMDYCVHAAAMCYLVANRMITLAKNDDVKNMHPLFYSHYLNYEMEKDWEGYLDIPPYEPLKDESGNPCLHNNNELWRVMNYLDVQLMPMVMEKMRDLADLWNDVEGRKLVYTDWCDPS